MRQLILDLLPENPPDLDNFVPGGNVEAKTTLIAWESGQNSSPFVFLWGESGSGKTHLLRACASEFIDAANDPGLERLSNAVVDKTAVDNIEALNPVGQIVMFELFNRLRTENCRLLVTARQPPLQLTLREDLRTRLGSGLIFRLIPLSDEEKMQALTEQADARKLALPPGALNYLLTHAPRNMRYLMAFIDALDRYSLEHKRPITLSLLREILQHNPPEVLHATCPV